MICNSCETQWPDMCQDCKTTIKEEIDYLAIHEDQQLFEDYQSKRLNISSGEDACLELC